MYILKYVLLISIACNSIEISTKLIYWHHTNTRCTLAHTDFKDTSCIYNVSTVSFHTCGEIQYSVLTTGGMAVCINLLILPVQQCIPLPAPSHFQKVNKNSSSSLQITSPMCHIYCTNNTVKIWNNNIQMILLQMYDIIYEICHIQYQCVT